MRDFESSPRGASARARQKNAQLCRQVFRTLVSTLPALDDDVLLGLSVEAVEPYPDASRLLVLVRPAPSAELQLEQIYRALGRRAGRIRVEVARAITRKRAPELTFIVMPGTEVQP